MKNLNSKLISRIALILALSAIIVPASADEIDAFIKKSMVEEILLELKLNTERLFKIGLKDQSYIDPIEAKYLKQPLSIPVETEVEAKIVTTLVDI